MATTERAETGEETAGVLAEIRRYTPDGSGISEDTWKTRHRRILLTLFAHVPFLLAVGLYDGTETLVTGAQIPATPTPIVLGELGLLVGVGLLAAWSRLPRRGRTVAAAVGAMISSTLLVQVLGWVHSCARRKPTLSGVEEADTSGTLTTVRQLTHSPIYINK